jgi:hypothetical protein
MERHFMLNEQAGDRVPNSAANPLSTVFSGAKIPLPAGSAKSYQAAELNYVFAVEQALFGGRETVSPWCQGHATGSTYAPDPAAGALVIAGLCRHVVG